MTAHKNRKRLIRERQARTGESYTAARRHLTPTETDVVLAGMDLGDTTVRAVRDPVGDVQIRFGDDASGQPVLRHRPMQLIDDSRVLAFGLLPDGAVNAEAVSPDGERVSCTVGPGVWLVVRPDNRRGAELIPVLFRDRDGAPVNPGVPADWEREAVGDREVSCPACTSNKWDVATAAWEGTGHMRNTRWGHGSSGPKQAFVCRVCGHEEQIGSVMRLRQGRLLPHRIEPPEA